MKEMGAAQIRYNGTAMEGENLKALILCAGKGTRLRPLTYAMPKHLIPVAGKPILEYALEKIKRCGIEEVGIVISPETGGEIVEHCGSRFDYIVQEKPLGIAHAVKVSRDFLKDDPFLLFLGDNLLEEEFLPGKEEFLKGEAEALIYLKEVEDPRRFGVAILDRDGLVQKVVEKPKEPPSNLAIVGLYFFSPQIHEAIEKIQPSQRGEYEITDAIGSLVSSGFKVKGRITKGWWLDTGKKEDLLEANRVILRGERKWEMKGEVDRESSIEDQVEVGEGTRIIRSQILGPAIIGRNCLVEDSLIEPFTCLGEDCIVINSRIASSIIMKGAEIKNVSYLKESIIGRRARIMVSGSKQNFSIHAGDETEVLFW